MSNLFIFTRPPGGNCLAREALDVALTSAAFDIPTQAVFTGEGITQLLKPIGELHSHNQPERQAGDLLTFGIHPLYYLEQDLERYQLDGTLLLDGATPLTPSDLHTMIAAASCVQSF